MSCVSSVYNFAMLRFPDIDPIAFSVGGLHFYWYGLMYVTGFLAFLVLGRYRAYRRTSDVDPTWVGDMMFYGVLGTVLGGRLGYILLYNTELFVRDWTVLFRIWEGGMSFHGGLVGVAAALWLFSRRRRQSFVKIADFVVPMVPIGLGAGRLGNFINGELWGRPSDLPWAMVFPHVDAQPRHPSQLYEFALEGVLLFVVLWIYTMKPRPSGMAAGLFCVLYALFRFGVEFVREPDRHIGFIGWDWITMGHLLSVPLFIVGLVLMLFSRHRSVQTS